MTVMEKVKRWFGFTVVSRDTHPPKAYPQRAYVLAGNHAQFRSWYCEQANRREEGLMYWEPLDAVYVNSEFQVAGLALDPEQVIFWGTPEHNPEYLRILNRLEVCFLAGRARREKSA